MSLGKKLLLLFQIFVMKKQKSEKDFLHLVDSAMLPVLTKGLQSKTERVQSEFIDVLLEAVLDDGRLGNNVNIASLRNNTDDPGKDPTVSFGEQLLTSGGWCDKGERNIGSLCFLTNAPHINLFYPELL